MMMAGDPKKLAVTIVKAGPSSSYHKMKEDNGKMNQNPETESEDPSMDEGLQSAAEEILSAIETKDSKGLVAALKDFVSMCDDYEDSEEENDEPSEA